MKKILVICVGGFSSSVFAKELEKMARRKGFRYQTKATLPVEGKEIAKDYDLVMISPQAFHELQPFKSIHDNVIEIPSLVYGQMDSVKALEIVNEALK